MSSHVLAEVEQTVDDVVILARGRLVKACPLVDLVDHPGLEGGEIHRLKLDMSGTMIRPLRTSRQISAAETN